MSHDSTSIPVDLPNCQVVDLSTCRPVNLSSVSFMKMEKSQQDPRLSKIITRKVRTLKPYEKKFIRPGEFRYDIPIPTSIAEGHPTVCYDRQSNRTANASDNGSHSSLTPQSSSLIHQSSSSVSFATLTSTPSSSSSVAASVTTQIASGSQPDFTSSSQSTDLDCIMQENPFLGAKESYFYMLKVEKAISIFADFGRVLVIKDICNAKEKLHADKYILIQRESTAFQDVDCRWIYWCSCNSNNAREISSLASNINMLYEDVDHRYSTVDNILYEVPDANILCCGGGSIKRYGLISISNNKFVCLSCNKYYCEHVTAVNRIKSHDTDGLYYEMIENLSSQLNEERSTHDPYKAKLISHKKIPVGRSQELSDGLKHLKDGIGTVLLPDQDACHHCGGDLQDGDPTEQDWVAYEQAVVVTNNSVSYAKVYYRPCSQCDSVSVFEGQSQSLLNLGTYLVGYDVLRSYMHSFLHGRRPLYTFYQTWCDVHLDYGNTTIQRDFSYEKLRHAWNSYIQLLDVDYSYGFSCPDCGGDNGTPDIVICEGTTISFQRRMWEFKDSDSSYNILKLSYSSFSDRVFLEDALTRKLLRRYAGNGDVIRGVRRKPLDVVEKRQLFSNTKQSSTQLYELLQVIEGDNTKLKIYRKLLLCLASPSPVCVLLRPSKEIGLIVQAIAKGVDVKEDPVMWNHIHLNMPIFFENI